MISKIKNKSKEWLIWFQKYTKTDMFYLTKGGFWLSFSRVVGMAVGFGMAIGFANLLPQESFGIYKFTLSFVGILTAFSLTGLPTAVTRSVAKGFDGVLKSGFTINLKWSFAVLGGGLIGAAYYFLNDNATLAIALLIGSSFWPLMASGSLYAAFLEGKKDFRRKTSYDILRSIIPALALLLTIIVTDSSLIVILVYFAANTAVVLFLYYHTLHAYRPGNTDDPSAISYGKHLSVMGIIGRVAAYIDKILVFHFLGAAPLAIYTFATAPIDQLQAGKKILAALALPKLSTRSFSELQRSAPRKAAVLFIYSVVLIAAYTAFAPFLYRFIFPQYLDSVFVSRLYALTLLSAPGLVFLGTLEAHQKKKELYMVYTINPLILFGLFLILLPAFGLVGLVTAHVISKISGTILAYFFVKHPLTADEKK